MSVVRREIRGLAQLIGRRIFALLVDDNYVSAGGFIDQDEVIHLRLLIGVLIVQWHSKNEGVAG